MTDTHSASLVGVSHSYSIHRAGGLSASEGANVGTGRVATNRFVEIFLMSSSASMKAFQPPALAGKAGRSLSNF